MERGEKRGMLAWRVIVITLFFLVLFIMLFVIFKGRLAEYLKPL